MLSGEKPFPMLWALHGQDLCVMSRDGEIPPDCGESSGFNEEKPRGVLQVAPFRHSTET